MKKCVWNTETSEMTELSASGSRRPQRKARVRSDVEVTANPVVPLLPQEENTVEFISTRWNLQCCTSLCSRFWGHVKSCLKKKKSSEYITQSHWARRDGTEAKQRSRRCHFKADNYVCHPQDQDVATSPDCILMLVYSQLETCFHKLAKQHLKSRDLIRSAAKCNAQFFSHFHKYLKYRWEGWSGNITSGCI